MLLLREDIAVENQSYQNNAKQAKCNPADETLESFFRAYFGAKFAFAEKFPAKICARIGHPSDAKRQKDVKTAELRARVSEVYYFKKRVRN